MSFYGVTDVWTYVVGAIAIILLPGPNSLYVLSVATARGVKAGYQGACGVFVGDTILLLLTALGAAGILKTYPALFTLVKYSGAAYLSYVGLSLIWASFNKWRSHHVARAEAPTSAAPLERPFHRALMVSLLNPKAILFLLSFFVQFIDPTYDYPAVPFLILGGLIMIFSALYLSVLILAGIRLADNFRQRPRLTAGLSASVGCLFIGFGSKLATATLH